MCLSLCWHVFISPVILTLPLTSCFPNSKGLIYSNRLCLPFLGPQSQHFQTRLVTILTYASSMPASFKFPFWMFQKVLQGHTGKDHLRATSHPGLKYVGVGGARSGPGRGDGHAGQECSAATGNHPLLGHHSEQLQGCCCVHSLCGLVWAVALTLGTQGSSTPRRKTPSINGAPDGTRSFPGSSWAIVGPTGTCLYFLSEHLILGVSQGCCHCPEEKEF